MAKKNKKRMEGIVFSTDPDFGYEDAEQEDKETLPARQQNLRIQLLRLKGNKQVTQISGFVGSESDLKELGKQLKGKCGCGGSVKDGLILLQGDFREKVKGELDKMEYRYKMVGG